MLLFTITLVFYQCSLAMAGAGTPVTSITLEGVVYKSSTVSVIDGGRLALGCRNDFSNYTLRWSKLGNSMLVHNGATLVIEKVRIEHRGDYICTALGGNGNTVSSVTITVNVLWSPTAMIVDGPNSALTESVTLTCKAGGNPEPSYWWSYKPDGVPVVGRGQTFTEVNYPQHYKFYCFAENTLIPTLGDSVTSSISKWKHVTEHVPATIQELLANYSVEEGSTFDHSCKVHGTPQPFIWWTKYGYTDVINDGSRFVVPNSQRDLDGYYTCYTENNVTNAAGISRMVTTFKHTYIHVLPKGSNAQETKIEKVCSDSVLAALALGWILAVVLLTLGLCYFIRTRSSRTPPIWSKHHQSAEESTQQSDINEKSTKYTRPVLPVPPNRPGSLHSYMSVRHPIIDQGNPDCNNLVQTTPQTPTDGYLTPESLRASSGYVEPNNTASGRYEELDRSDKNVEDTYESI